ERVFESAIGAGSTADARIDVRWGAVDADNSRRYAAELVALAPNVILASACFWPNPHLCPMVSRFLYKRRDFITLLGGAAAWPLAARAQQGERLRPIGMLMPIPENEEGRSRCAAFRDGLRALGRAEGRDIQIETRWAAGDSAKVQAFANELVSSNPNVILANATTVARALQAHTSDIPVVFVLVSD